MPHMPYMFFDKNGDLEFYRVYIKNYLEGSEHRKFIYPEDDPLWKQIQVVWKENEIAFIDFYLH